MADARRLQRVVMPTRWCRLTVAIRSIIVAIMVAHITGIVCWDYTVAAMWHWLYAKRWLHVAMLEAVVAAFSFFAWIVVFRTLDTISWLKQFRFVQRPQEGFQKVPVPVQDVKDALAGTKPRSARQRRVLRVFASFPVYLGGIWLLHLVRDPRPIAAEPPTFLRLVGELAFGIFAYDFFFYWIHLSMHLFPLGFLGHMIHHELAVAKTEEKAKVQFLEAEAVVNHSLLDGTLQVVVNIVVQNLQLWGMPKHKLSRLLHNILVTYLLTEAHCGLDLPWGSHRLCPWLFGGAPRHEIHHQSHRHCYHQFFMYLDDLLGYGPPKGWMTTTTTTTETTTTTKTTM